jgi:antitoxin HicB
MTTTDQASQKTLEYYLSLPYPILLVPPESPDETWFVKIPLLEGCMSDGPTPDEALENLKEAQTLWLEVSLEHRDEILEPNYGDKYIVQPAKKPE